MNGEIGRRVRECRQRAGLLQRELAERMGSSDTLISQIEQGHKIPGVGIVARIAAALGIPQELLTSPSQQVAARTIELQNRLARAAAKADLYDLNLLATLAERLTREEPIQP